MRAAERVARLEERLPAIHRSQLERDFDALLAELSNGEIDALEELVRTYGSLEGPVVAALLSAADARRQGHRVGPLFPEPERRYVRTPHPTSPDPLSSVYVAYESAPLDPDLWRPDHWYRDWYAAHGVALPAELSTDGLARHGATRPPETGGNVAFRGEVKIGLRHVRRYSS